MKRTSILFVLVIYLTSAFGTIGSKHKAVFSEKDIFQSAYFLKNTDGLCPDYHGREVRYFANHDGVVVFLTDAGPIYKMAKPDGKKLAEIKREKEKEKEEIEHESMSFNISYTTVKWIGANPHPRIEESTKATGYYSFLAGKEAKDLHSIVTDGFAKVTYHDLYPGIDVEYSFPEKGGMKYNIIVHPGADASVVKMEYGGSLNGLDIDKAGNLTVHTVTGDIMEHSPVSYLSNGTAVSSAYQCKGNRVVFSLPDGYDKTQTLIIDPWVSILTQLVVQNIGTSVDYDLAGNLYVYGAGSSNSYDVGNNQQLAKFDISGNFLWVFAGSVPSVSWATSANGLNLPSNAKVDKVNSKVYIGQAFNSLGNQIVRLTSTGVYDNFISLADINFQETWSIISNCQTGDILALGGGTNSNLNMGVINPVSGAVSTSNITGLVGTYYQDIVSGTYDALGNLYVVMASSGSFTIDNYIFKSNTSYSGNIWNVPSGYLSFSEGLNLPAFDNLNGVNSNNFNALAANGSYLYYYDGVNIAAYSLSSGATLGSTSIPGYTALYKGGIAVDNCNNVYVGGLGVIKTFTFNGTTFTDQGDISLGAGFAGYPINDIRYNSTNSLLYVTGGGVVGTFNATLSANCAVVNTLTANVTATCGSAIVHVTPGPGLVNPVFSFQWQDSAGNILRQTVPDTLLVDTVTGITSGQYSVQVQLNVNCGGAIHIDSFTVVCNGIVHIPDTSICAGHSATLVANATPPGGTYLWQPGGATTSSITVSPSATTAYSVSYTSPSGTVYRDTVIVTIQTPATLFISPSDTTVLPGQSVQLLGTFNGYPQSSISSYLWTPATGLSCLNCPNPVVYTDSNSAGFNVYNLVLIYNNGCQVTASDTVRVDIPGSIAIPTAFSPNGDGKNDLFFIPAHGTSSFSMHIYNRWGQEVFISTDISHGWDGNYRGQQQPGGEYQFFFTVNFQNGKSESHTGSLTLFR